ncbi:MAG: hypothetical protein KDE46_16145 [Caldilineaceae bacterium]|nr:hypothetical protein [Caldilineaceae bacterium]
MVIILGIDEARPITPLTGVVDGGGQGRARTQLVAFAVGVVLLAGVDVAATVGGQGDAAQMVRVQVL